MIAAELCKFEMLPRHSYPQLLSQADFQQDDSFGNLIDVPDLYRESVWLYEHFISQGH